MIELKPHQVKASNEILEKLDKYKFCMLSGEPRTGKTLTIIEVINRLWIKTNILNFNCLIVTKLNAIASIEKDIANYITPKNVVIETINFESVHKVKSNYYDLLIIDEVHCIGYIQKPKLINKRLSKIKYGYYIGMSGSIFLETFATAYSLYKIAFPLHKNFYSWAKEFVNIKDKYIGQLIVKDYTQVKSKQVIMYCIEQYNVVMTQDDSGFKTKVKDIIHYIDSANINKLCKTIRDNKKYVFKTGQLFIADTLSMELQAIKQLQSGGLKIGEEYLLLDKFKVDYIAETFKDKKIAIYYNYISERMMLELYLKIAGYEITDSAEVFNATDKNTVFIGQFVSKREGVNLSASNDVIFMSVPFSNLSYLQARERCILRDKDEEINCHILCTQFDREVYRIIKKEKSVFNYAIYKSFKNKELF